MLFFAFEFNISTTETEYRLRGRLTVFCSEIVLRRNYYV